jgi:hypothetical protein
VPTTPTTTSGHGDLQIVVAGGAIDRRPRLIARCIGTADVVAAVRFSRPRNPSISTTVGSLLPWPTSAVVGVVIVSSSLDGHIGLPRTAAVK